ncbi:MAG: hypothetical protein AABX13_03045 [Nanoarchaeota archaeon]
MSPSLIYAAYRHLQHWQPARKILPAEELLERNQPLFALFSYCYALTENLYRQLPSRKNGEVAFLHPFNVVSLLKKAKITDQLTLCAGMLHDYVEEKVDMYKRQLEREGVLRNKVFQNNEKKKIEALERYEAQAFQELEDDLLDFTKEITEKGLPRQQLSLGLRQNKAAISPLIGILKLLTRHKRHFYYKSISAIFDCPDQQLKERAIQVKLADRLHNILCLDCFEEKGQLFQCFKNLFILNNVKAFLAEEYGVPVLQGESFSATEKLFNKCARATYDAFLAVAHNSRKNGIAPVTSMLQLAFKKYALEKGGLWAVTEPNEKEVHLLRLYQGVIRKYDARLHHEFEQHEAMKKKELQYCREFFNHYNFSQEQLEALLCYKDAYSLKEIVAYLIYDPDYVLSKFLCAELNKEGRIKGDY